VFFAELRAKNVSVYSCAHAGDTVDVLFFGVVKAGQPTRYDIGFYLDLNSSDAVEGYGCYHGFLSPICPKDGNTGCLNITGGTGPFYNAETDNQDICGDVVSDYGNGFTTALVDLPHDPDRVGGRYLRVPCLDSDNNGIIDIGTCISWDNNPNSQCTMWSDTFPGTPSKCRCERIDIGLPINPGGGGDGGSADPAAIGIAIGVILAALLLASLGFLTFVIIRRRRKKPAPVVAAPPQEPEPVPMKAAAPAPVVDKPKDWTAPGTRYIGFGHANMKVKWGADAPPSAPRGHDKYDRWSMANNPSDAPPLSSAEPMSPSSSSDAAVVGRGGQKSITIVEGRPSCCALLFPCCFRSNSKPPMSQPLKDDTWESSSPTSASASNLGAASTASDVSNQQPPASGSTNV